MASHLARKTPSGSRMTNVKFLRYSQEHIERRGSGVMAMITNHGYLDNPTFRGMRQHLMQTFDKVYVLDLHGNAKKKEIAPDGSEDKNVFDIQQGVAISIMFKKGGENGTSRVFHADLYGSREHKYDWLTSRHPDMSSISWHELKPQSPNYLFKPIDLEWQGEYERQIDVTELTRIKSVGIATARDKFTIRFTPEEVWDTVRDFISMPAEEAREKYDLRKDVRDWKVDWAQQDVRESGPNFDRVVPILYRPFDVRYTYYTGKSRGFLCMPRPKVSGLMLSQPNLSMVVPRRVEISGEWQHVFVARTIVDHVAVSSKTIDSVLPLYSGHSSEAQGVLLSVDEMSRTPNLLEEHLYSFGRSLNLEYSRNPTADSEMSFGPEDVFHYVYAILHCPTYRTRYSAFLKLDFPRFPLPINIKLFRSLSRMGGVLVALHLLDETYNAASWNNEPSLDSPLESLVTSFQKGVNGTTMGSFSKNKCFRDGRIYLDTSLGEESSFFDGVRDDVWAFPVGGYQVLYKWLYDRRGSNDQSGRTLTDGDILHYQRVVVALQETMRLMDGIDKTVEEHGGWPDAFQPNGRGN